MKFSSADPSMVDQSPRVLVDDLTLDNSIQSFINEESKLQEDSI